MCKKRLVLQGYFTKTSFTVCIQPFKNVTTKTKHDICFMICDTFTRYPFPFTTQKTFTAGKNLSTKYKGDFGILTSVT